MKYFECTITRPNPEQDAKKITEIYLTSGVTFGDAEDTILNKIAADISGEIAVTAEKIVTYNGILEAGSGADTWYNVKTQWTDINEKGKEIRNKETYLVPAENTSAALHKILQHLENTMLDYEILAVTKTKIRGVYL